ncbi:hypothetical protein ABZ883_09745 [Streptomyces sp. NPDC046977]|uniref:hypothetical protein n=1 Tax=Streptomyces sp. NPDC046977 TaxID=3154703 RepID=UPI0033FEAB35
MSFRFSFTGPSAPAVAPVRATPPEPLEDLTVYGCGVLARTDAAFHIGGFGWDDWHFDVGYDMSAFVEELPGLIDGLRAGRETELDLCPQGVERTLTFRPDGERVRIGCVSRTSWVPRPDVEVRAADELMDDCVRLATDVATAIAAVAPALAPLPPFESWLRGDV